MVSSQYAGSISLVHFYSPYIIPVSQEILNKY